MTIVDQYTFKVTYKAPNPLLAIFLAKTRRGGPSAAQLRLP